MSSHGVFTRGRPPEPQPVVLSGDHRPRNRIWNDGLGRAALRSLQVLLVLALVVVVTFVAVRLRLLVVPLLIAALVAAAANPVVDWLQRRRVPRALSVWLTMLAAFAVLGGLGWWITATITSQWDRLSQSLSQGIGRLQSFLAGGPLPIDQADLEKARQWVGNAASGSTIQQSAVTGATMALQIVTGLVLGLVLLYFLLKDGRSIWRFLREQLPARQRDTWDEAASRSAYVAGRYLRGTAVVALVDATVIGGTLLVLGVPLALPLAVLVFLGAFIPIVGATVTGALSALVALVSGGPVTALIVLAVVVVLNQLEGDVLAPIVYGQALSLHPLAILLALTAGTIVAGVIGAILAVPLAGVLWTVVTTFRESETSRSGHA